MVVFNWNLVLVRMNLKPAALIKFVFDWALSFRPCKVYHFQNLVGFKVLIKRVHDAFKKK